MNAITGVQFWPS